MSQLILRRLVPSDETTFAESMKRWDDPAFIFVPDYVFEMNFADFINRLDSNERGIGLSGNQVPDTCLFGFVGEKLAGRLSIRHRLNEGLLKVGGNIGYAVLPQYRRRGFASEMLRQALPIANGLGIERALLTCDDNNLGSIKTIESNGGVLENKISVGEGRPLKRRYWIATSKAEFSF